MMHLIKGTTKLLGVIGDPVEHSLSPVMHNAAIAHLQVDYVYLPLPVRKNSLEDALKGFEAIQLQGFNITIPHKQAIIPLLDNVSPEAEMVGAVNTVWKTPKGWQGTNTDVEGFLAPLKKISRDWSQVTPVILGYGGAARAVVTGCVQLGCPEIHVLGRNSEKLAQFQKSWNLSIPLHIHPWEALPSLISQANLLVNTTPVGMYPYVNETPVFSEVLAKLPSDSIAYDLIYTPNPTQFLKLAQHQGMKTIDGSEMLVCQGAAALKIWLQQPVPVEVMMQALQEQL